jgi:DNA-binding NarL/FixJ family response regulator
VRVLLVGDHTVELLAIQRELAGRFELRVAHTLAEALDALGQPGWRPDAVLTELDLPDSEGLATLHTLQCAAPGIPVLVSTGAVTDTLRRQLDALGVVAQQDQQGGFGTVRHAFPQLGASPSLVAHRIEIIAEIDRVTRQAADAAVARAIDQLLDRLGLGDEEGLRMAIRLARGWEAAKIRFISAVTTGVASAFLLAVGAGIVAMLRHGSSK